MSRRPAAAAGLLVLALALCAPAQQSDEPVPLTLEGYQAELERIAAGLERLSQHPQQAPALRASIAERWTIATSSRNFQSDNNWLRYALIGFERAKPEERASTLRALRERLAGMRAEAQAYAAAPAADPGAAERLRSILARHEFREVRGPSAWDKLKARIARFVYDLLERILSKIPARPQVGQTVVWVIIAVAAALLALWLYRRLRRRDRAPEQREIIPFAPSAKNWRRWLAEARAAAERGDWRDAVHLAYWSAISRLEEDGAWVPDRARTPREYLRLLSEASGNRSVLTDLTGRFEAIWYGNRPAGPPEFQAAVAGIERLQCRP